MQIVSYEPPPRVPGPTRPLPAKGDAHILANIDVIRFRSISPFQFYFIYPLKTTKHEESFFGIFLLNFLQTGLLRRNISATDLLGRPASRPASRPGSPASEGGEAAVGRQGGLRPDRPLQRGHSHSLLGRQGVATGPGPGLTRHGSASSVCGTGLLVATTSITARRPDNLALRPGDTVQVRHQLVIIASHK